MNRDLSGSEVGRQKCLFQAAGPGEEEEVAAPVLMLREDVDRWGSEEKCPSKTVDWLLGGL